MSNGDEFNIIAFCCNWCGYRAADSSGNQKIEYPAGAKIIRVMCSGMVHPNMVIDALTKGADAVLVVGCHQDENLDNLGPSMYKGCHYVDGNKRAESRAEAINLMLEDFGLEPERFRIEFVHACEGYRFAEIIKQMAEDLQMIGPSPYKM